MKTFALYQTNIRSVCYDKVKMSRRQTGSAVFITYPLYLAPN
jgi:hypothetical protein